MPLPESIEELVPGIYADAKTYETVYINPLVIARDQGLPTDPTSLFNIYNGAALEYTQAEFDVVLIDEQEDNNHDND